MRLILREATNVLRELPGNLKTVGFPKAKQSCSQKFAENNKWMEVEMESQRRNCTKNNLIFTNGGLLDLRTAFSTKPSISHNIIWSNKDIY